jgi:FkbM family methyltransferase
VSGPIGTWLTRARRGINATAYDAGRRGLRAGVLPSLQHQPLLRALRPDFVVDVGANRGQFSLDVVRACPGARIVAFEPIPGEASVYERVLAGCPGVRLVTSALGATSGTATLHLSASADSSSLFPISRRQSDTYPGTHLVGELDVAVQALDDCWSGLDPGDRNLLKIDVQGGELDVLRGAVHALRSISWVYVEVSFVELYDGQPLYHDVADFLGEHGFVLGSVNHVDLRDGRAVQADALFERPPAC